MTRVKQFENIRRDHRLEQLSIRELARKHKVHRRVMRQALASATPPERRRSAPKSAPVMGPYEDTVRSWSIADKDAPKKQRYTARRVWTRLVAEEGAPVAESTVREAVRRIRAEIADRPGEAMVPQVHELGQEAEVDFGELWARIAGVMTKLWLFSMCAIRPKTATDSGGKRPPVPDDSGQLSANKRALGVGSPRPTYVTSTHTGTWPSGMAADKHKPFEEGPTCQGRGYP